MRAGFTAVRTHSPNARQRSERRSSAGSPVLNIEYRGKLGGTAPQRRRSDRLLETPPHFFFFAFFFVAGANSTTAPPPFFFFVCGATSVNLPAPLSCAW